MGLRICCLKRGTLTNASASRTIRPVDHHTHYNMNLRLLEIIASEMNKQTWPCLSRIRNSCAIELALDRMVSVLRPWVVFPGQQFSALLSPSAQILGDVKSRISRRRYNQNSSRVRFTGRAHLVGNIGLHNLELELCLDLKTVTTVSMISR